MLTRHGFLLILLRRSISGNSGPSARTVREIPQRSWSVNRRRPRRLCRSKRRPRPTTLKSCHCSKLLKRKRPFLPSLIDVIFRSIPNTLGPRLLWRNTRSAFFPSLIWFGKRLPIRNIGVQIAPNGISRASMIIPVLRLPGVSLPPARRSSRVISRVSGESLMNS